MGVWDKYLNQIDDDKKKIVISILGLAKKYSTDAVEEMPYGVPGLKLNGKPLIAVATHKGHYGVYPFSPKVIQGVNDMMGNNETAEGTIRFKYGTLPSDELIKKLIGLRSQEIG